MSKEIALLFLNHNLFCYFIIFDITFTFKLGSLLSEGFEVTKGLRQRCCISPTLFKIYVEKALNIRKRKCCGMGYNVDNTMIHTLQFADDQVVMARSKEDLEYTC